MKTQKTIKLRSLFISLLLVCSSIAVCQNTWQTAQSINHGQNSYTISSPYTDYWFVFTANTEILGATVHPTSSPSHPLITGFELYYSNGSSLLLVDSLGNDSIITITTDSLIIDSTYYLKVSNQVPSEDWILSITDAIIYVYEEPDCPPPCDELVFNGDFDDVFWAVTNSTCNPPSPNPFFDDPFNQVSNQKGCAGPGTDEYANMVCAWQASAGSPQIKPLSGSNAAYMWSEGQWIPEGIYTNVRLVAGKQYTINFDYTLTNNTSVTPTAVIAFNVNQTVDLYNYNALTNQILTTPSQSATLASYSGTSGYTFTATNDFYSLVIYPENPSNGRTHFKIDNIYLTTDPPLECPKLSGNGSPCPGSSCYELYITNYDPTYVYQYTINGGPVNIAHSNPILIDVSDLTQNPNIIRVKNWCECETEFTVYPPCEIYSSAIPHNEFCNQQITQSDITQNKIEIHGVVEVAGSITLNNCDIRLAPSAKLVVLEGNILTINGGTIEDGCLKPWDGIYVNNTDDNQYSKLILNGVTSIKGAYNAVVTTNNGAIEIINNNFTGNNIGILVQEYKPRLCGQPAGSPPPVVPPYEAVITGNTFTKGTVMYAFQNNYGISVEDVYDITIGDGSSNQNLFQGLNIGVKVKKSLVSIYNNRFEDINSNNSPVLSPNLKPHGNVAIYAANEIVPNNLNNNPPPFDPFECVGSSIYIGSSATNSGNTFDNCDFGIYAYRHLIDAQYNTFTNQRYNAVWVWDVRSVINHNNIQQKAGVWYSNNSNLNTAILLEKTFNPSAVYNLQYAQVVNNTITNTRTGINLVSCSSSPNASTSQKTLVKDNSITFDNHSQSGNVLYYEYHGIWLQHCDRILVRGNSIENNSGVSPASKRTLIGIRVDKSRDTWIDHNFDMNNLGSGIWVNGDCHNTQFYCNELKNCTKGIYTYSPLQNTGFATIVTHQGSIANSRPQDNFFINMSNPNNRIDGQLNINFIPGRARWRYRSGNNGFYPNIPSSHFYHQEEILPNPQTLCTNGIIPPPDPEDEEYLGFREENYGYIVRNELDYIEYEDEFEYYDSLYLYELLYSDPDIMNLGEPEDTPYVNFYNYLTNSNIREFVELQELIDENDINQALMDNGAIVAQNVIETNRQYVNNVYLNSFALGRYFDSIQEQTLMAIAMLTPYIGGDAVYSARVMLGINPNDYGLAYRQGNFQDSSNILNLNKSFKVYPNPAEEYLVIEFNDNLNNNTLFSMFDITGREIYSALLAKDNSTFSLNITHITPGIYHYVIGKNPDSSGAIIITK